MKTAEMGSTVTVHYVSRVVDGEVLNDTRQSAEPLTFTLGAQQVIPGFEKAIVGMQEGETKTFVVPSDEAFGPYLEENVVVVDRSHLPSDLELVEGQSYVVTTPEGDTFEVKLTKIEGNNVTLDANHPLAGKDIEFTVEVITIAPAE